MFCALKLPGDPILLRLISRRQFGDSHGWFVVDDYLQIDLGRRAVRAGGYDVRLTQLEFDLLKYLANRPGVPCGRSDLIDMVWGYDAGGDINDSAVNTAISKLRKKIELDPANPRYIHSVHGIGYRFVDFSE